jgi:hypothetical protein
MYENKIFKNQIEFEVLSSTSEGVIFKSIVPQAVEKNGKDIVVVESTTTLHFFDPEDLARLKEIEKSLISKMEAPNNKKGFLSLLSDFLEI